MVSCDVCVCVCLHVYVCMCVSVRVCAYLPNVGQFMQPCALQVTNATGLARTVYTMYMVYHRTFGDLPAMNTI